MAGRSIGAIPFVLRVKTKEELMRLKQLEGLVRDLGKEVIIRYLEYLVGDTQKVVQCQMPKNVDKEPAPDISNADKDRPFQDRNKPKVELLGKLSYNQFLSKRDSNKITFEEFITAAQRWGANIVGATAGDLKGYLLHLSLVSAMAATQRYDQQMHVDYDKAIRKKAEEVGWAAFKADNTTVANLYYDTVVVDEHQSTEATIRSTSETVDLHHADNLAVHEKMAAKEESDVKDSKWQSVSTDPGRAQGKEKLNNAPLPQDREGSEHRSMTAMLPTPEASVIPKQHICSYCSKGFGSATTLKVHLRRHTVKSRKHTLKSPAKRKIHLCSFCGKQFKTPSCLKQHLRHHTGERPYPCTVCGEKLISAKTLSEHMMRHTANKQCICSYCGKQFYSSSGLTIHTRIHTGEKPHVCPYCGKGFRGSGYMKSHMLVHTHEKRYKCSKCDRGFSISCNLKRHMLTHTGEKPYKCPHCSMAYTRRIGLKTHIELCRTREGPTRHKPKYLGNGEGPHICSDCGKQYRYLASLKVHMITHTGGNPLTCPECYMKFSSTLSLRYHMMSHTGEKPYQCKECGKVFPSSANLDVHATVHTGEKPYVCSDCGKAFSLHRNLQRHKMTHTGEKNFVCYHCGKAFGTKSSLQLHIMIHTGEKPFVCAECGKGFSRGADLRKHMKVHVKKTA